MTATATTLVVLSFLFLQASPQPAGVIQGRVVRSDTNEPVAHARLVAAKIEGALTDYRTVTSDASGGFVFRDLSPGNYRVYAQRDGYLQAEHGKRPAGTSGTQITLAAGASPAEIVVRMTATGAIAGRVLDRGKPVRNVYVRALKPFYFDGRRNLNSVEWAVTDDRGEYRLFDLPPGLYFVSAAPNPPPRIELNDIVFQAIPSEANRNQSSIRVGLTPETLDPAAFDPSRYPPVYHPGTTDITAAVPVEVKSGATAMGIELSIARASAFRVRGRILVPDGVTLPPVSVGLVPSDFSSAGAPGVSSNIGVFEIAGVLPGKYYLSAQTNGASGSPRRAIVGPFEVTDRDVEDLPVILQPAVTVNGRVSIEGRGLAAGDLPVTIQLRPATPFAGYTASIKPDGTFSIPNVSPADYRVTAVIGLNRPLWLKSARFGVSEGVTGTIQIGSDAPGKEIEVLLSPNPATLEAMAVDEKQQPVAGALIVVVPDVTRRDRSMYFRTATTDASGRVKITPLVPGDYQVFATEDIEAAAWQDPNVLRRFDGRGQAVRFQEGGQHTVTVRIQR